MESNCKRKYRTNVNDHFEIINLVKSKNKRISITAYGTVNIIDDSGITGHEKSLIPIDCYLNHTVFTKPGKNIFAYSKN